MSKKPEEKNVFQRIVDQYKDNRMARILLATILLIAWILILELYK